MMVPAEKIVIRQPEDQNGSLHPLLVGNQYEQITNCVEKAYAQAVASGDMQQAALLTAAKQLCASCLQMQYEVSFHQEAYHHSETRRDKLNAELSKLLGMMQLVPETAVSPQHHTFWRRLNRLLHREEPKEPELLKPPPYLEPKKALFVDVDTADLQHSQPIVSSNDPPALAPEPLRPRLTVYCLGTFRVYEDDHPIEEWPSRKGKSIFKYLLLHRWQRITKEVLMAQFWPEATADAARNNLNVAIYGLRKALRNGHPDFSHVLFQDDCYFLNPEMDIWVDMEAFEDAYLKARQLEQQQDTAVVIHEYHAAEALYLGELFAEDRYEDWPTARRQQLHVHYLQLLTCLIEHYFAIEQYPTCITFANKLLLIEPCHEATHRLLMRAYARQQQGYLALRQYHHCVEALAEELAVPPDPTTVQLYEAIRAHQTI
jgi:DNA-binding SARP family transcriptional activator